MAGSSGAVTERAASSQMVRLYGVEPETYRNHMLHAPDRAYPESDCFTDIWIELLNAGGYEPLAAMGMTLKVEFEGDQWTFFKPLAEDLGLLFGIDFHESQPYRPLPLQLVEQLSQGRTLLLEVDSWYLPDTHGTSYRSDHVKTTIAAERIEPDAERLYYFHNTGLFEISGQDYRGVLRLNDELPPEVLPPYVDIVRFDVGKRLEGAELKEAARLLLHGHLHDRPIINPFVPFGAQLERELPRLLDGDLAAYHAYAFATVRMFGAAFEIGSSHVEWLFGERGRPAAEALTRIVEASKTLSFKLARRRPFEPAGLLGELASSWDEAVTRLDQLAG
jgi:Domain of unknown function (DUF1839)